MRSVIRWVARIIGATLSLFVIFSYVSDARGPHGLAALNLFRLPLDEQLLLGCVLVACAGLLLAWFREETGGWVALVSGGIFLVACLAIAGMREVWELGALLAGLGVMFVIAGHHPRRLAGH